MSSSSYSFSRPSQAIMDNFKGLGIKTPRIDTPLGKLSRAELSEIKPEALAYGPYIGHDEIMGKIVYWHLPIINEKGCENLAFAIKNLSRYQELRETYKTLIEKDPLFRWFLIFILLCGENIREQLPPLANLPKWSTPELFQNKTLFQSLVEDGALYKHYLVGAYGAVNESVVAILFNILGPEARKPLSEDLEPLMDPILEQNFSLAWTFIEGGVSINNRIDSVFGNTVLHYLVALEDTVQAIELINQITASQEKPDNNIEDIDYTIQDKQGKTVLLFAVGLGLEPLVDCLLKLASEKKKNIGLNIPDQEGRSPLMLALALGYSSIRDKLLAQGASLSAKDKQQRDIQWYTKASEEDLAKILSSVSVNPERGAYCKLHSYLSSDTANAIPLVLIDKSNQRHLILRSAKKEHLELIHFALLAAPATLQSYIGHQMEELMADAGPDYNKSIAEYRKAKQVENNAEYLARLSQREAPITGVAERLTLGFISTEQPEDEKQVQEKRKTSLGLGSGSSE